MTFRRSAPVRAMRRVRRSLMHLVALLVALAVALVAAPPVAAASTAAPAAAVDNVLRVALFWGNAHASQEQARVLIKQIAAELALESGQTLEVQETNDAAAVFTPENLAKVDTLVFTQNGGVLFNEAQRAALKSYIEGGGGWAGMHYTGWSVGQSEHDVNPFYLKLVGAMSEGHPEAPPIRPGRVYTKATGHPLTQGPDLPAEITRSDEWYDWTFNPAPNVRTLFEVDEKSYQLGGRQEGRQGTSHPITWCQRIGQGRSWYTGMGHEGSAYSEPYMKAQLKHGIAYGAGLRPTADCSPPEKGAHGAWSGVVPWPLMPINVALTSDGKVQSFGSKGGPVTPGSYDFTGDETIYQGGQVEIDVWDPNQARSMGMTTEQLRSGIIPNNTYTDLFCSMQVQNPHNHSTMTVGGDDGLGENAPNDGSVGVTSYSTNNGLQNEAPMNIPRWYPTGTTMPDGSIVVQGGSLRGGPGGPGVLTPEIHTPDEGSGWKLLTGARNEAAYGSNGQNRWWYPRAFVVPENGNLFNISGTQMFELDPDADGGKGAVTLRGPVPPTVANQAGLGNPVGATSTAVMYAPGKILQVGGGWWGNGGGPDGARAGFTVDLTTAGGTAAPLIAPTEPMKHQRHWATSTVMPDGKVIVTGGSRQNADHGGYVTNAEIWDPATGKWSEVEVPYEHARLYHSTALLLPDGRIMIGGGGAPGPRNYSDVEYYSPAYLFDGNDPAPRPTITAAPKKVGYNGTFQVSTGGSAISRVTLVRNGSTTHSFNNDQNFQELKFTQSGGTLSVTAPKDGTYAPPGAYMLFLWDDKGTPSVAKIVDVDPSVKMDVRTPRVVEQFEYPRFPADQTQVIDVAAGSGRMAPWTVENQVQLVRGIAPSQGALGATGYHVALGAAGTMTRTLRGLDAGRDYRISLRYARDSRSAADLGPAAAQLSIGSLDATLTAGADLPSQGDGQNTRFGTYVGTFTASARSQALRLAAGAGDAGMMVDNLVITAADPGTGDAAVHYRFDEGAGTTAANTGTDRSVGPATLTGGTGWTNDGVLGKAVDLPGGTDNAKAVDLPDNLLLNATEFTTSFWVRPELKRNWTGLFHIGDGFGGGDDASYFQIQMATDAAGPTGLAATFKGKGPGPQERVYASPTQDVTTNRWNHVVFTRQGSTGTLYLDGKQIRSVSNLTVDMADIGATANNWLGRNGFGDAPLDGQMDDVRLYTSALSAQDVAGLYADGTALDTVTTVKVDPPSPSAFGAPLTVSSTVKDKAGVAAKGQAELWVDGARVGAAKDVVDGAVTFEPVTLSSGQHTIQVRFAAAEGWRDSTSPVATHTVNRQPPGAGVPIHYKLDEGQGTTAANSGTDSSVGAATLQGTTGWTPTAKCGPGVNLPGGSGTSGNHVKLPDNIQAGMDEEFTVSVWARPDALPNWVPLVQIGSSTDTFFLLQSNTQANGATGFAATFKKAGNAAQERLTLGAGNDLPLNAWTHVVYTHRGTTGKIYFDGVLKATRTTFPFDMGDVGVNGQTAANFLGGTSWNDPRFDGLVDELRMYAYELSGDQVAALASATCPTANQAPAGAADAYSTPAGKALTVAAPGVLTNDTDSNGDKLTATGVTQPANGQVTLAADGSFTYTPKVGFAGSDSFTYKASDGTLTSGATTVTISVERAPASNTAPAGAADSYDAVEGQRLTVPAPGVLANDTDADGQSLTATGATEPANGQVTLAADGSFTYTPRAGFTGTDSFTYRASDGTATSAATTVTLRVLRAGGTGGGPLTTAVTGAAQPIVHGQAGSVSVAISPEAATGTVELSRGATTLAKATIFEGRATLVLPARVLPPGSHDLTLRYGGDAGHKASSSVVTVTVLEEAVRKSTSRTVVKVAPRKLSPRENFTVVATVRSILEDSPVPTGKVKVRIDGRLVDVGRLDDGRYVLRVKRNLNVGRHMLSVTYAGDSDTWWSRDRMWFWVSR